MAAFKRKKYVGLQKRKAVSGYLFISPFIIGFLVFMISPLIQSFYMSFCEVTVGAGQFDQVWVGLKNYYFAFRQDASFPQLLTQGALDMFVYTLAIMVFSFFVALILNQNFHGRALVRAIFFLPVILSSGVMLGVETDNAVMSNMQAAIQASTSTGTSITETIQIVLRTAGIGVRAFETVFEIIDNIYDVAVASGIQIIIFLSGLQTIPKSMYEAAQIEGCTAWESLWKITFPMISSIFLVNWFYTIVDYCMRSDSAIMKKIQGVMILQLNYGLTAAMSWIYFAVVLVFVGITSALISRGVYYYD
ncbi:MAG: sugar ABC transporter permease [Lachnospiraceae bacterium]|nr:sugar ABC transporter permease [Lachnospiraceae bacterium]